MADSPSEVFQRAGEEILQYVVTEAKIIGASLVTTEESLFPNLVIEVVPIAIQAWGERSEEEN